MSPFECRQLSSIFSVVMFITLYKVVLTFESVTILMQDLADLSSDLFVS